MCLVHDFQARRSAPESSTRVGLSLSRLLVAREHDENRGCYGDWEVLNTWSSPVTVATTPDDSPRTQPRWIVQPASRASLMQLTVLRINETPARTRSVAVGITKHQQ